MFLGITLATCLPNFFGRVVLGTIYTLPSHHTHFCFHNCLSAYLSTKQGATFIYQTSPWSSFVSYVQHSFFHVMVHSETLEKTDKLKCSALTLPSGLVMALASNQRWPHPSLTYSWRQEAVPWSSTTPQRAHPILVLLFARLVSTTQFMSPPLCTSYMSWVCGAEQPNKGCRDTMYGLPAPWSDNLHWL